MSSHQRVNTRVLGFEETAFESYHAEPYPPQGHIHDTFEISVFVGGAVTMLYGGLPVRTPPDRLTVHWGMLPHQIVHRDPGAMVVGLHVPLTWILQWQLPEPLLSRLLKLDLLVEPGRSSPCSDLALLLDWHHLLTKNPSAGREIVLAEVRARLLRIAASPRLSHPAKAGLHGRALPAPLAHILAMIARRFREPIRIADIARTTGISPRHLTRIFHKGTGQTINGYLTRLRLSHAQRLLASSDRTVTDIMQDAGFSCPTHFYQVFASVTGTTPGGYRRRIT